MLPRKYLNVQRHCERNSDVRGVHSFDVRPVHSGLLAVLRAYSQAVLRLRTAMKSSHTVTGIPQPVTLTKYDEIGLEEGYNDMVIQLEEARQREEEERANP